MQCGSKRALLQAVFALQNSTPLYQCCRFPSSLRNARKLEAGDSASLVTSRVPGLKLGVTGVQQGRWKYPLLGGWIRALRKNRPCLKDARAKTVLKALQEPFGDSVLFNPGVLQACDAPGATTAPRCVSQSSSTNSQRLARCMIRGDYEAFFRRGHVYVLLCGWLSLSTHHSVSRFEVGLSSLFRQQPSTADNHNAGTTV